MLIFLQTFPVHAAVSCWQGQQAGSWVVKLNLCMCSYIPSSGECLFWISSVGLAEEGLPSEGLRGKSCPPCTDSLFLLSSKSFRGQKCRFVLAALVWWLESPWLGISPSENQEDRRDLFPLPLPTISFRLIPSSQPHHSLHCCRRNPEITGINWISGAKRASFLCCCSIRCLGYRPFPCRVSPCRDTEIAFNDHNHELVFIRKCDTVIYICQYFTELSRSLWTPPSKMFQATQLQ